MINPYKQGDIVLVPFPFSDDVEKTKPRPALVVSNSSLDVNEVIVVQITSNISRIEPNAVFLNKEGDTLQPLPTKSVVRCHLLSTVHSKIIYKKINEINRDKLKRVLENIRILFELEGT